MPAVAKAQTATQPAVKPQTATQPAVKPQTATQPAVQRKSSGTLPAQGLTAPAPALAAVTEPQPAAGQVEAKSLSDLFTDVPQPSEPHLPRVEDPPGEDNTQTQTKTLLEEGREQHEPSAENPQSDSSSAPVDPFAALGPADPSQAPPPGESTNFFIAQAGVKNRNPPWKIALIVGVPLVLLVGGAYLLQMTHIVPMEVTRTNENGEEVKESFFSPGGVSALKDLLSGDAKARREAAEKKKQETAEKHRQKAIAEREHEKKEEQNLDDAPKSNKPPDAALQALYGDNGKNDVGPRVKKNNAEGDAKAPVAAAGKWAESANKVVADHLKSFQLCVEEALHRNPNIKVGKVTLTLTIGTSGAVKDVKLDKFGGTDLGGCIQSNARRLVFPGPEEPLDLEVPLTLGVTQGG
jgi:hypothetical protein